jgi:hypothetical protein
MVSKRLAVVHSGLFGLTPKLSGRRQIPAVVLLGVKESCPEARSRKALIGDRVPEGDIVVSAVAANVYGDLKERCEKGDDEAQRFVNALAVDGLMPKVKRTKKDNDRAVVEIGGGEVVNLPTYYGLLKRPIPSADEEDEADFDEDAVDAGNGANDDGEDDKQAPYSQLTYIFTCPREAFDAIRRSLGRQYETLGYKKTSLDVYAKIWDRHPKANTLEEACRLDGKDPMNIAA